MKKIKQESMFKPAKRPDLKPDCMMEGIKKCLENSVRLYQDACILLKNNKNNSATFVFQLSKEEFGKALLLFDEMRKNNTLTESNGFGILFFGHKEKQDKFIKYASGKGPQKKLISTHIRKSLQMLDDIDKLGNIYVNWTTMGWHSPLDEVDESVKINASVAKSNIEFAFKSLKKDSEFKKYINFQIPSL